VSGLQPNNLSDVAALRQAFDESFAQPPAAHAAAAEDFLGIRVAGSPYALRLLEAASVGARCHILALPSEQPDFLGLAGLKGELLPIYSLASLLGHGREEGEERWLVVCGAEQRLGLVFSALEGFLRVPRSEVYGLGVPEQTQDHVQEVLRFGTGVRPIVRVASIISSIGRRIAAASAP
jgi:purine-binding chemotaxis protein CheW